MEKSKQYKVELSSQLSASSQLVVVGLIRYSNGAKADFDFVLKWRLREAGVVG